MIPFSKKIYLSITLSTANTSRVQTSNSVGRSLEEKSDKRWMDHQPAGPYSNIIRKEFLERETKKRIHERESFIFFQCGFVALN
jgi:hypothetical protein